MGFEMATTISGIIADEMAIGMINNETTAVRILPIVGKNVEFGGWLLLWLLIIFLVMIL